MKVVPSTLRVIALAATLAIVMNVSVCGNDQTRSATKESLAVTLAQLGDTNAQAWGVQINLARLLLPR